MIRACKSKVFCLRKVVWQEGEKGGGGYPFSTMPLEPARYRWNLLEAAATRWNLLEAMGGIRWNLLKSSKTC